LRASSRSQPVRDTITMPRWVDFHCHLDLYPDHRELIQQCEAWKIATLAITTTPKAFERNVELAMGSPHVMVALGLHPQLVAQRADELALFERLLLNTSFVGEVGLDAGSKFYASFDNQQRIFERILRACDEQGGKILSIHSVRAVSKVLKHLELSLRTGSCIPVMHWFTGTRGEAKRAAALGCYFSINSEMIRTPKMHSLLASLPIGRILTETDGPFVEVNGRPTRPTDIPETVKGFAKLRNMSDEEMASQVAQNLVELLAMKNSGHPTQFSLI